MTMNPIPWEGACVQQILHQRTGTRQPAAERAHDDERLWPGPGSSAWVKKGKNHKHGIRHRPHSYRGPRLSAPAAWERIGGPKKGCCCSGLLDADRVRGFVTGRRIRHPSFQPLSGSAALLLLLDKLDGEREKKDG